MELYGVQSVLNVELPLKMVDKILSNTAIMFSIKQMRLGGLEPNSLACTRATLLIDGRVINLKSPHLKKITRCYHCEFARTNNSDISVCTHPLFRTPPKIEDYENRIPDWCPIATKKQFYHFEK